jgi:hypothetical protein
MTRLTGNVLATSQVHLSTSSVGAESYSPIQPNIRKPSLARKPDDGLHGYEPTREAAMEAFAKSWRHQ